MKLKIVPMIVITSLTCACASVKHNDRKITNVNDDKANVLQKLIDNTASPDSKIPGILLEVYSPKNDFHFVGSTTNKAFAPNLNYSTDMAYRIASITKVFTAAAIFRLIEENKIELYAPITKYLSKSTITTLTNGGYNPQEMIVEQLLAHTTGLFDYATSEDYFTEVMKNPKHIWTRDEQIEFAMKHGKPTNKPGETENYTDTGYLLLSEIMEAVTGEPMAKVIREKLKFSALGMNQTYFEWLEPKPTNAAERSKQFIDTMETMTIHPSADQFGGGGLVSTTRDLTIFFRALLRGEIFENKSTLSMALIVPNANRNPKAPAHANLLGAFKAGKHYCWAHAGFGGNIAMYCPDIDTSVAFAVNQENASNKSVNRDLSIAVINALE